MSKEVEMEWISVKKELPKIRQLVDIWVFDHVGKIRKRKRVTSQRYHREKNVDWFGGWSVQGGYVTHWMPRPSPPKAE